MGNGEWGVGERAGVGSREWGVGKRRMWHGVLRASEGSSTQGADGHIGALRRGDARGNSPKFKSPKRQIRQGRGGGCARGESERRFFSGISEEGKKTDALVRCGAVVSEN